ncbi:hypothetical protein VTO73DRAFT_247 [Trametes versicolor]
MPASDALAPGPTPTPCTFILWTVACATSHCLSISPLPSPSAHVLPGTSASHAHIHGPRRGRVSSSGVAYHSHRIVRRLVIARSPPAPVSRLPRNLAPHPPSASLLTQVIAFAPPPAIPLSHRAIFAKRPAPTTPHPNLITLTVCCFSLAAVYEYDSHPGVPRGTMPRAPHFRSLHSSLLFPHTHTCRVSLGLLHASTAHAPITHPSTLYSSLLHMQYAPLSRRTHSSLQYHPRFSLASSSPACATANSEICLIAVANLLALDFPGVPKLRMGGVIHRNSVRSTASGGLPSTRAPTRRSIHSSKPDRAPTVHTHLYSNSQSRVSTLGESGPRHVRLRLVSTLFHGARSALPPLRHEHAPNLLAGATVVPLALARPELNLRRRISITG